MNSKTHNSPTMAAQVLGYGGLVPFVGLSLAVWMLPLVYRATALTALLAYGASILSFLGAIHWGFTLRDRPAASTRQLVWGVVPSLTAWVALLLPPTLGLWLLAAGLWVCFAVDRVMYLRVGVQAWLPMRLLLTLVASLSCLAAAWNSQS